MSGTDMLGGLLGRDGGGYVVRARRGTSAVVKALSGTATAVSGYFVVAWIGAGSAFHLKPFFIVICVLGALASWKPVVRPPEVLRIDHAGVRFGAVAVPWDSVWQFVVQRHVVEPGGPIMVEAPQLGLRLKRGAPLPQGIDGLITDPNDPLAIPDRLRSDVARGRLDVDAAVAAAMRCAPPDVELVDRVGEQETVLSRHA